MVAFVTHALRIVLLVCMGAFCDRFSCPPHFATFWLALNHYRVGMQLNALLFFIIFGSYIWKKFSDFLDTKINDISEEILIANNLHQEAKKLLSEEKKKLQGLD